MSSDYDLKGRDYETELLGAITDTMIDADRLARLDHRSGLPSFALYRLVIVQERLYLPAVRRFWVLFSLEWCRTNMRSGFSEELAGLAAMDSLQRVMDPAHPILPAEEAASGLGVDLETYTRARNALRDTLRAELDAYWTILCGTYRIAAYLERRER
jgi:hypothetical protein